MSATREPVQVYMETAVLFMALGVFVLPFGIAAEAIFGYTNATENAFTVCLSLWFIGILVGAIRAGMVFPGWREKVRGVASRNDSE